MTDKLLVFFLIIGVVSVIDGIFVLPMKKADIKLYNRVRLIATVISVPLIIYALYQLL